MTRIAVLTIASAAVVTIGSAACSKPSRRDVINDLRPQLSAIRKELSDLTPTLPDPASVAAARIPDAVLEIDASDPQRDNTIIIGVETLRDPYDPKRDDLLEVGFAYQHRFLQCLRDVGDGSTSGALPADAGYRAGCERAAAARYALLYKVVQSQPARFQPPNGAELLYEPGALSVAWYVVDLGPPEARPGTTAKLVGEAVTAATTPAELAIAIDKGTELGLVDARRQAAEALAKLVANELGKVLIGRARHVSL